MSLRRVTLAGGIVGLLALGWGVALAHAALTRPGQAARLAATGDLVAGLGLTDLALFTEARYTRHPAMADLHTAFQDDVISFDHFPTAAFAPLPAAGFGQGALFIGPPEGAE